MNFATPIECNLSCEDAAKLTSDWSKLQTKDLQKIYLTEFDVAEKLESISQASKHVGCMYDVK